MATSPRGTNRLSPQTLYCTQRPMNTPAEESNRPSPKHIEDKPSTAADKPLPGKPADAPEPSARPTEHGGPPGPEPTRYGDWERKGRCTDF